MRSVKLSLAVAATFAALVLTGAAIDAATFAQQGRRAARPAATPTPAPSPGKKNERPADPTVKQTDPHLTADQAVPAAEGKRNARAGQGGAAQRAGGDAAGQATPAAPADGGARYSFEFAQPQFVISRYVIEHDAAGRAKISFQKKTDGLNEPPVVEAFDISPAAAARIRASWDALKFLDSTDSYQADKQFPHLGTMRLRLRDGGRDRVAEFNWTNHEHAKALASEYRSLAEQQFFVFDMALARQYQPSEAIKILNRLETLLKLGSISDPPQLLPLLRDLATDERIPLIARNHTERLIKQIQK